MSQSPLKLVVDTCVYADFLRDYGRDSASRRALEVAYRHDRFAQSTRTMGELRLVMNYPNVARLVDQKTQKSMLHAISSQAEFVNVSDKDLERVSELVAHRADKKFLALAEKSGADCLLTRDHGLLDIGQFRGVDIISPARFLQQYGAQHNHAPVLRDEGFFLS